MRFNEYLITEDARTDFLETAQCIGIVASKALVDKVTKFIDKNNTTITPESVMSDVVKILDQNYDWNARGKNMIKNMDPSDPANLNEVIEICSLISGMATFMKDKGSKIINRPQFIHDKIDVYYKAEKKSLGEIKGAKANTADCIITSHSASDVIKAMNNKTPVEPDEKNGFIKMGDMTLIQVSLKKSRGGAQIGKIAGFLSKNLGILVTPDDAVKQLGLVEGVVWDRIKGLAGDVWDKLKRVVSSFMGKLKSKYLRVFRKGPATKDVDEIARIVGVKESIITEGKITTKTQAVVDMILANPAPVINAINTQIREAKRIVDGNELLEGLWEEMKATDKVIGKNPTAEAFSLISNYSAAKTMINMTKDASKISDTIRRLVAEMLFGGTSLPLWKVYGHFGGKEKPYEYLGTIETFMAEQEDLPVEVFGFRISPVKGTTHYSYKWVMLEGFEEDRKIYIELRAGTNSSSRLTFNVEGTKKLKLYLDEPISQILTKR